MVEPRFDTHRGVEDEWRSWIGRTEVANDVVLAHVGEELRNVLHVPRLAVEIADPSVLPAGGHWLLFTRFGPADGVGTDGHPRRGGFLPPITLPRRMWAGGRVEYLAPIHAGESLTRTSTIASVDIKAGSRSPLVFVSVHHEVSAAGTAAILEVQDLVYTEVIAPKAPSGRRRPEPDPPADTSLVVTMDEVTLFRYSALTRNSHRIHFDLGYARSQELYPDLVVHGPLTATLLQWLAEAVARRPLRTFAFRGRAPLYVRSAITFHARWAGDALELEARGPDGRLAMTADARF
jgi:3-methylfumaryl-CoA hydratase